LRILKLEIMTESEENKLFRLECEQLNWRTFRDKVENFRSNEIIFGFNTLEEKKELDEILESIKYY